MIIENLIRFFIVISLFIAVPLGAMFMLLKFPDQ